MSKKTRNQQIYLNGGTGSLTAGFSAAAASLALFLLFCSSTASAEGA